MAPSEITPTASPEAATEKQVQETVIHLEDALATLNIDPKDADEAFAFLRDHPNADGVTQEAIAILADDEKRKRLLRKIDWAILPCMIVTYFLQFLDKTTIGYTAVMGLREDTHLKGQDYSNVAMIFVSLSLQLLCGSRPGSVADKESRSMLDTSPPSFRRSICLKGSPGWESTWAPTSCFGVLSWPLTRRLRATLA
jgi:hypothetical protein